MTRKTGLSPTLRQRAFRAGFDIDNPAVRTNPGNPPIEAVLADRNAVQPHTLLARTKSTWNSIRSRLPFFASGILATSALTWPMPVARAADGAGDPRYRYPTIAEILERIDWWATSHLVWGCAVTGIVAYLSYTQWRQRRAEAGVPLVEFESDDDLLPEEEPADDEFDDVTEEAKDDNPVASETAPQKHYVFGASRKGLFREENQDAFEICALGPDETLICVCDGVGGLPGGREMARKVTEAITDQSLAALENLPHGAPVPQALESAIAAVRQQADQEAWTGLTTLILAHIRGQEISWANLGDGELAALFPDGNVAQLLVPHHRHGTPDNVITAYVGGDCTIPPRLGTMRLEEDTMVFAMSDGASAIIDWKQLQSNRELLAGAIKQASLLSNPADALLAQIEAAKDPATDARLHHDNMTLALVLIGEADHG